jgi:protein required for attachment to host cells
MAQTMKNWLVVANSARARVLEETDKPGVYRHVADLVHPESRQKGVDLAADGPGHYVEATGTGSSAYQPRTDVREREHDRFAQEVAALLNKGVASSQCAGLILVASNPFLGELKGHLGTQATKAVLHTVPSDYTTLRDEEIAHRLSAPPGERP